MNVEIFKKLCINRYFELEVAKAHRAGHINIPIYLSIGQDHIPAIISEQCGGWPLFIQHRCHSWCLSWGMPPISIAKELLGRKDGCNKGMGGSASLASKDHNIFGHSGLLGDQIPIAVGYAQASQQKTICVLGDAAAEEDYALASFGYAATHNVPILFVCEDNDLSILTEKKVRRSWRLVEVAKSLGLNAFAISDSYKAIEESVQRIKLPGLINISTTRHMWHAGSGQDTCPKHDILPVMRKKLSLSQEEHQANIEHIEYSTKNKMERLWQQLLT